MNRNALLDVSRAIAVMFVTTYHIWRDTGHPSYMLGDYFDLFGFMGNGWIGVGIFFVISGYCMGISTARDFHSGVSLKTYLIYIAKRFMRIAPPYYIAIAIWVFIIDNYHIANKGTSFFDIITHVTFSHNFFSETLFSISGVFWTIAVEMQFYILLPFFIVFMNNSTFTLIIFFISLIVSFVGYYSNIDSIYKWSLIIYLPLFLYGYILHSKKIYIAGVINKFKLIYLFFPLFLLLLSYKGAGYDNNVKPYEIITSIVYGLLMLKMISESWRNGFITTLSFIGSASFSIYLYNYIYMSLKPSIGNNPVSSVTMWLSVISVGIVMYFTVEIVSEKLRRVIFKKDQRSRSMLFSAGKSS
ncbi:TPA: acyltransferase family protein [Morganella morganii]